MNNATKDSGFHTEERHSIDDVPELNHDGEGEADNYTRLLDNEMEPFKPFNEEYTDFTGHPGTVRLDHTENREQTLHPAQDFDRQAQIIERLLSARRKWENHHTLSALIAVFGSVRYSVGQYEYTRNLLKDQSPGAAVLVLDQWPSYYKSDKYFGEIMKLCLPHSEIVKLPKKTWNRQLPTYENDAVVSSTPSESITSEFTEKVRIFLPSAWAKLYVATSTAYELMSDQNSESPGHGMNLEYSMIVLQRELITNSCDHLVASRNELEIVLCGPGASIKIWLKRRRFDFDTPFLFEVEDELHFITAKVVVTWYVGARGTENPSYDMASSLENLTKEQRAIMKTLSTADCRSNSSDDIEYEVMPGDIYTLLIAERRSLSTDFDELIINRFWRLEDGKPSVIILWLRAHEWPNDERGNTCSDVEVADYDVVFRVCLSRQSSVAAGCIRPEPRRNMRLADGTPYTVYRILLYCDDFQKSSSASKKGQPVAVISSRYPSLPRPDAAHLLSG